MYRGTTPTLIYKVKSNLNLDTVKQIWVTLKNYSFERTYDKNEVLIDSENNTVTVELSQEDTLKFYGSKVQTQIRVLVDSDKAFASNIKEIDINDILKEGVING